MEFKAHKSPDQRKHIPFIIRISLYSLVKLHGFPQVLINGSESHSKLKKYFRSVGMLIFIDMLAKLTLFILILCEDKYYWNWSKSLFLIMTIPFLFTSFL